MKAQTTFIHSSVPETILTLKKAIMIYERNDAGKTSGYATIHEVKVEDGSAARPQIMAGVPATRRSIGDLLRSFAAADDFGFLPENLLSIGTDYMMWWRKPQVRNVWFNTEEPIGARCGKTPHPGLVFAVMGGEWWVFAVCGDQRPMPDTPLFQAPYFNVYDDGGICTGNVQLPQSHSVERIAAYEDAFFDSVFTHPNVREKGKLVKYRSGPFSFWKMLLDGKKKSFPEQALVPLNRTVGDLVKAAIKGGVR